MKRTAPIEYLGFLAVTAGLWTLATGLVPAQAAAAEEEVQMGDVADESGDDAAVGKKAIPDRNLLGILKAGGPVMIPLLFCSVVLMVFLFERAISLRRGRVIPGPFVKRFLHQLREGQLDRERATALCLENKSPVAKVFAAAVRKWGRPEVEVEQVLLDAGERAAIGLRRYLRVFNALSTVCPLMGLLGTVFGIIQSFNSIGAGDQHGRAQMLASGIGEALLTTATGLTVAIPALVCYWLFVSRVDQLVIEIDALSQDVVNVISAEAISEGAGRPARARKREAA